MGDMKKNRNSVSSTVLSVNPEAESGHKIEHESIYLLKDDQLILRDRIMKNGKSISHPGIPRQVTSFVLEKQVKHSGKGGAVRKKRTRSIIGQRTNKAKKKVGIFQKCLMI